MENTAEHLEHVEHAQHAAHSPFDRRVAMTMAIVAALLACVTMLSHRAHNETLRLQAEGIRLQSESNIFHTRASDQWNFYQAKNIRYHEYKAYLRMLGVMAKGPDAGRLLPPLEDEWTKQTEKYAKELPQMEQEAKALEKQAEQRAGECQQRLRESEQVHHQGDRFDLSELAVELALVLCSIAILTKQRNFWYTGIVACVIGVGLAGSAFLMPHHADHGHSEPGHPAATPAEAPGH